MDFIDQARRFFLPIGERRRLLEAQPQSADGPLMRERCGGPGFKPLAKKLKRKPVAVKVRACAGKESDSFSRKGVALLESVAMSDAVTMMPIRTGKVDRVKREVECFIIKAGPGNKRDRHFYGPEAMRQMVPLLEGAKAYLNHQTAEQEQARPEGDIKDLCGHYRGVVLTEALDRKTGKMVEANRGILVCDRSAAGDEALAKAEQAIEHARIYGGSAEPYAGISVNADGETEERMMEVDGETSAWNYVTHVRSVRSADVVTRPARGGEFIRFLESWRAEPNKQEAAKMIKGKISKLLESAKVVLGKLRAEKPEGQVGGVKIEEAEQVIRELGEALKEAQMKTAEAGEAVEAEAAEAAPTDGSAGDTADEYPGGKDEEGAETEAEALEATHVKLGPNARKLLAAHKHVQESEVAAVVAEASRLVDGRIARRMAKLEEALDLRECQSALREANIPASILTAKVLSRITDPVLREDRLKEAKFQAENGFGFNFSGERSLGAGRNGRLTEVDAVLRSTKLPTFKSAGEDE